MAGQMNSILGFPSLRRNVSNLRHLTKRVDDRMRLFQLAYGGRLERTLRGQVWDCKYVQFVNTHGWYDKTWYKLLYER